MSQFLTADYLISFLFSVIRMSTPIIFCALGALIANHAGAINMALEGIMLTASLLAVMFSAWMQSCYARIRDEIGEEELERTARTMRHITEILRDTRAEAQTAEG